MKNASQSRPYGFTIVELLIVIVVIAIIATISIVAYSGVTNRSYDTAVQADLRNFAAKIMEFHALNDRYPNGFVALGGGSGFGPIEGIGTIGFSKSSYAPTTNNIYYCTNSSSFAVGAMS